MSKARSPIEVFANLNDGEWKQAITMAYTTKSPTMDWLGLEATLRNYVRATGNRDIDEIVAAFTKRGNELPCPQCGQAVHVDNACTYKYGEELV